MPAVAVKQPYAFVLRRDESPDNPRDSYDHFGNMICFHKRYSLGDEHDYKEPEDFLRELARAVPAKDICAFVSEGLAESVKLEKNPKDGNWLVKARYFKEFEEVGSCSKLVGGQEDEIAGILLDYMDTAALLRLAEREHVMLCTIIQASPYPPNHFVAAHSTRNGIPGRSDGFMPQKRTPPPQSARPIMECSA